MPSTRWFTPGEAGVLTAVVICAYVGVSGITTLFALLSRLYREFDDPIGIGWAISCYYLVSAVGAAVFGRFGDLYGRRRMVLFVLPIAAIGALVSAWSSSLALIVFGCAVQGVAGALTPLTLGIVRESLPQERVPTGVGIVMASLVAGGGLSFMVAGLIVDHYSWTGGFYLKVVLALPAFAATLALVPDRRPAAQTTGMRMLAGVAFALPVAAMFVASGLARSRGWGDPWVLVTLLVASVVLCAWVLHQLREPVPLIDVRLLGQRRVLLAILGLVILCLGCMQNGQVLSMFLQQPVETGTGFGLTATGSGLALLALLSVAIVVGPMAGALATRFGVRLVLMTAFASGVAGWTLAALFHGGLSLLLAVCALGSVCVAAGQTASYSLLMEAAPEDRTSEIVGLANILKSVFMGVGAQVVALLLTTSMVDFGNGRLPSEQAYVLAFGYIAIVSVIGVLVGYAVPRRARIGALHAVAPSPAAAVSPTVPSVNCP